jgi:uncharacterized OsmC-like protein
MPRLTDRIRNGVDTEQLFATINVIKAEPDLSRFQFRAVNRWIHGAHSRSTIRDFYGAGQEDVSRAESFALDAGEPTILLGSDTGANPVEYLLHALAACLTTSVVFVAAARGIRLSDVECRVEGDLDVRGMFAIDDECRNGFERIRAEFSLKGHATPDELRALVARAQARSGVLDTLTNGVPVELRTSAEQLVS